MWFLPRKGSPLPPPPYISLLYIIYHISLLHPRWDEQCRDTMMTIPPQLTSSLPSFSYPASFRYPPPASNLKEFCQMLNSDVLVKIWFSIWELVKGWGHWFLCRNIYIYIYLFINIILLTGIWNTYGINP